jgi:hypothetical protein
MSTLVTNTITGLSTAANITIGSTPVVSASANSLTIRGEGSAQTSVQQGLAKSWINFNGTGTIAARDSFNVTSITDDATGNYRVTIANDMASVGYSISGTSMHEEDGTADARSTLLTNRSGAIRTATIFAVHSVLGSSQDVADAFFDANNISTQVSGDLA